MKLEEIKSELVKQKYCLICLYNERREKIIPYNQTPRSGNAHSDTKAQWVKIEEHIKSPLTPDGTYTIGAKQMGVKSPEQLYQFAKGSGRTDSPKVEVIKEKIIQQQNEVTMEEYKSLLIENAKLEAEIERLSTIIERMQDDQDEEPDELADAPQTGADKLFSILADKLADPIVFNGLFEKLSGKPLMAEQMKSIPSWEQLVMQYQQFPGNRSAIEAQMNLYYPDQYKRAKDQANGTTGE